MLLYTAHLLSPAQVFVIAYSMRFHSAESGTAGRCLVGHLTSRADLILGHETSADLWNIGSLQLAFAEARPIKVCKPWMHLHVCGSALESTQALVGVLDQESSDQVSKILHTATTHLSQCSA